MNNSSARNIILFVLTTVIAFSTQVSRLSFDYNFENLFSTDNNDLKYYNEYREIFGNDNDYLLLAVIPPKGVFDSLFLVKFDSLEAMIGSIKGVQYTISPLSIAYPYKTPLGYTPIKYLKAKPQNELVFDSMRIVQNPELLETLFAKDYSAILLVVRHGALDDSSGRKLTRGIKNSLSQLHIEQYHIAGKMQAQEDFIEYIKQDFGFFLALGILLMILTLWWLFRSAIVILASIFITICTLIFTFGLMAVLGATIDIMAALIPLLLIIVSISDLIHFVTKYSQEISAGIEKNEAIKATIKEVGLATFLTSITTAFGFFTLATAKSVPISKMGMYMAIGVLAAYVFTLMLFTALFILISHGNISKKKNIGLKLFNDSNMRWLFGNQKKVLLTFGIFTVAALTGIFFIKINAKLIDDLPKGSNIRKSFEFFDDQVGGSKPWELRIDVGAASGNSVFEWKVIQEISKLESYIEQEYGVVGLQSAVTLVKLFNKSQTGRFEMPDSISYHHWPKEWVTFRSRERLLKLHANNETTSRITGFVRDFGSDKSIEKDEKLEEFIKYSIDNRLIKVRSTGTTYLIDRSHHTISSNLIWGLILAVVLVAILAGIVFKNTHLVAITLVCNILPIIYIASIMGYLGINLSLSNSIVFAVSFGIAVDDTLHFISRYQQELKKIALPKIAIANTLKSTGSAIIATSLVLMSGFLLFIFSAFNTSFYIGLLVSLTLLFALLVDLLLLPVLLLYFSKN